MSSPVPVVPASAQQVVAGWTNHLTLDPAFHNAAVTRCCKAWTTAYRAARIAGTWGPACYIRANEAYRNAMPPLTTTQNIRDFIACTAHGLMMRAIETMIAPKLLYAAQVATSAQRRVFEEKHPRPKNPAKTKKSRAQSGSRKVQGRKK
jgi:hypothetical protein